MTSPTTFFFDDGGRTAASNCTLAITASIKVENGRLKCTRSPFSGFLRFQTLVAGNDSTTSAAHSSGRN
jgi:hypothetical protein